MKLVICSRRDQASVNIMNCLLTFSNFEKKTFEGNAFYIGDHFSIAEVDERLIYSDGIDKRLSRFLEFDEIIFASRHSSKDERKILTAHVSGNPGSSEYGGKPRSLAKPAPITIKNYALALRKKLERRPDFAFTLEATHHGPSEIEKPSAFYEIGSTEKEWKDREAAEIVAEAIFEAIMSKEKDWKIAVGIGGTHYVPRQTEIILETEFTFGHNFAKYTFEEIGEEIIEKAVKLSEAEFIIYDDKSTTAKVKEILRKIKGVEVLKARDAKKFTLKVP
ncbi:MAG: D-aminoacyl-tRNA deacylase [Archaeoglobaceae archaeon]